MDIQKRVAWNLRRLRVERGLSQEALAVDAEIDRTYVSKVERMMENPTIVILDRVARALGVDITELFKQPKTGEKPPKPLPGGRRVGT